MRKLDISDDERAERRRLMNLEACARYRAGNPKRRLESQQAYRAANREKINERQRLSEKNKIRRKEYKKAKLAADPLFKVRTYLAKRIVCALHRGRARKSDATISIIGCSIPEFMRHIERQMAARMSWGNYGTAWHIDHIRPCASFNLLDPAEQKACFHFTNLQPLWAKKNIAKGSKLTVLI